MAPITQASDESNHQALMDKLDVFGVRKSYRNPKWNPPQRRNKNVRQIISETARKQEASLLATQDNSRKSTPQPEGSSAPTGEATPIASKPSQPNLAKADQDLSTFVREKNAQNGTAAMLPTTIAYTSIESAPSLNPSSQWHYCDITGLPAPYTDPKSRLRYHNGEIFNFVRSLGQHPTESYLAARGAHTVLK